MASSPRQDSRLLIIAFGSNLGDSPAMIDQALEVLRQSVPHQNFRRSSTISSSPVDCPPGSPDFLNGVVAMDWIVPQNDLIESAEKLLQSLKSIEANLGRRPKKILNEARPIDLDIIFIEGHTQQSETLTIPHPRAVSRSFVTQPILELFPGFNIQALNPST